MAERFEGPIVSLSLPLSASPPGRGGRLCLFAAPPWPPASLRPVASALPAHAQPLPRVRAPIRDLLTIRGVRAAELVVGRQPTDATGGIRWDRLGSPKEQVVQKNAGVGDVERGVSVDVGSGPAGSSTDLLVAENMRSARSSPPGLSGPFLELGHPDISSEICEVGNDCLVGDTDREIIG